MGHIVAKNMWNSVEEMWDAYEQTEAQFGNVIVPSEKQKNMVSKPMFTIMHKNQLNPNKSSKTPGPKPNAYVPPAANNAPLNHIYPNPDIMAGQE